MIKKFADASKFGHVKHVQDYELDDGCFCVLPSP